MHASLKRGIHRIMVWCAAALGAAAASAAPLGGPLPDGLVSTQALDTSSLTTDQNINVPTGWWVYSGQTTTQITSLLNANGARVTELQFESISSGVPRFTVRMVRNSGAYAATGGWWWYVGLTGAEISTKINQHGGRLIDIEPYDIGGGNIRYAIVMVSNASTAGRVWKWLYGATPTSISSALGTGFRLVDLDSYDTSAGRRYTAVMVANTGVDAETWEYWYSQSLTSLRSRVSTFGGRVIKLDRNSDGTYNFIQLKNTSTNASAWWHFYGFSTLSGAVNYANQLAARPVAITTYMTSLGRRWDVALIDNANAATRRMRGVYSKDFVDANGVPNRGIFAAYLKQVSGPVIVDLNSRRQAETASSLKSLHLLHAMKQVQLGNTTLGSPFVYYDYPDGSSGALKDRCPNPIYEGTANRRTSTFEFGLDEMMRISDNRTTRGVVLRYGMPAINATGTAAGLTGTQLRHNIGCAYRNVSTNRYEPATLRNNTTAYDLSRIYETVWAGTSLTDTNLAKTEFLESTRLGDGASAALQSIINAEAAALGKTSSVASSFGSQIRNWGKGGSYGTCLPDSSGGCGTQVIVRSSTGLIGLPIKVSGVTQYRTFAFAHFISDVPTGCWENFDTTTVECAADTRYTNAFGAARPELFREAIRSALQTW